MAHKKSKFFGYIAFLHIFIALRIAACLAIFAPIIVIPNLIANYNNTSLSESMQIFLTLTTIALFIASQIFLFKFTQSRPPFISDYYEKEKFSTLILDSLKDVFLVKNKDREEKYKIDYELKDSGLKL